MLTDIPTVAFIQGELKNLEHADVRRLATLSGVPFSTIWKIREGTTKNPGIQTVAQFASHICLARLTRHQGSVLVDAA